jgi:hypothetical protein
VYSDTVRCTKCTCSEMHACMVCVCVCVCDTHIYRAHRSNMTITLVLGHELVPMQYPVLLKF